MANSYVDYVGKVDVITDSENIKSLLKLPYTNSPVSMIVHRIGKSLLLDSFDVYRHVLLTQQEDWKWIRQFILNVSEAYKHTFSLAKAPSTRKDIEEKLMLSKFLYYSVQNEKHEDGSDKENVCLNTTRTDSVLSSSSPDPLYSEDEAEFTNNYERNILWNFEDMRMLVGTDMPIFGGGTHPCVTLRLRDMKKPINVLTGIDYWLDQLMSNVPEVVMCYHLSGIVQKYEVIKTEDVPNLPDGRFNPELVRDVAQNILSFLKQNATKEGHTYWLFKGNVCEEYIEDSNANPFTVPVAVLMYRVAKNLLDKTKSRPRKIANTVYRLLHHCLDLLDVKLLPQVVGSIHYLLSNLYLICGDSAASSVDNSPTDKSDPSAASSPATDVFDLDDVDCDSSYFPGATLPGDQVSDHCCCVSMDLLTKPSLHKIDKDAEGGGDQPARRRFIPNVTNLEDCCKAALEHVLEGLVCSQMTADCNGSGTKWPNKEPPQATSDPKKAIPLQYEPLRSTTDDSRRILPLVVRNPSFTFWQIELSSLLMLKAVTAYYLLADCSSKLRCYGKTLRYLKLSLSCFECVNGNVDEQWKNSKVLQRCRMSTASLLPSILMLCGDTHLMLSHQMQTAMAKHRTDFECKVYRDEQIVAEAAKLLPQKSPSQYAWCTEIVESIEGILERSLLCYQASRKCISDCAEERGRPAATSESSVKNASSGLSTYVVDHVLLSKRLGNAMNEFAVYYMNQSAVLAESLRRSKTTDLTAVEKIWNVSYNMFQQGIRMFHEIDDKDNQALLNSNCGKLFRLSAETFCVSNREFSVVERHYLDMVRHIFVAMSFKSTRVYFALDCSIKITHTNR
ncbi:unnamed protein product [Soboliphyme baturini]|uniref:Erythroid differentiation-related factor 1 n=1 Tax=Soboliphyme baturini TaxID=241478 RepID=A0A183IFQ1_9BILA|nr:unnamed protein product [Soboliphyme baturini]